VYGIDILVSTGEDGKVCCNDFILPSISHFLHPLGTLGRVPYDNLPARFHGYLPVENEKFAHRLLGSAKESRIFPFQHPCT